MKKGLNAWTFPNEVPMEKRIEITAKAGYDGFECLYEKEGYVGMNSTDAELKLVSLIDGGRTITSLPPYQSLGYEAIEAVYQIDVKGKNAYVITLDADGEIYEAAFDENGEMTLYTADGQAVGQPGEALGEALSQAREFYSTYLAGKE